MAAFILAGIDVAPFHGDEATYIWMSEDLDWILEGKTHLIRYSERPGSERRKQQARLEQGSLNTLAIGLAQRVRGMQEVGLRAKWDWEYATTDGERMWRENIEMGSLPGPQLLRTARLPSAALAAGSLVLLYLLIRLLFHSRVAAWAAVIVLGTNAMFLLHVRRAMMEGAKLFFLALALVAAAILLKKLAVNRPARYLYILLGLCSGLALAAKHDMGLPLAGAYLALALAPVLRRLPWPTVHRNLTGLVAASLLALAVFYAAMPIWWDWWPTILALIGAAASLLALPPWASRGAARVGALTAFILASLFLLSRAPSIQSDPLAPVRLMVQARRAALDSALRKHGAAEPGRLDTLAQKGRFIAAGLLNARPNYWDTTRMDVQALRRQVERYEASWLYGRGGGWMLDALVAVLAALGLWRVLSTLRPAGLFLLLLLLVPMLGIAALLPIEYQRHLLVLQLPYAMLAGLGVLQARCALGKQFDDPLPL